MKKLLLLLLLLPTLIQAEDFNLVCEGEKLYMFDNQDGFNDKETIAVKVKEKSIKIKNNTYSTSTYDSYGKIETNYLKNSDLITVTQTSSDEPSKKHCGYITYTANIDRITGMIKTEWRQTDKCMSKDYFAHTIFEGKCKKQKGNAF